MTTIAVTGATGHLGRLALAALKQRAPDATLVALVRDPARAADLEVEVRLADYNRPETLAPALNGVDVLVLISSNDMQGRAGQHRRVIDAARAVGVGRIVYTSILKGDASPMLLAADHVATEAALRASGVVFTLLRNGWYTENHLGALAAALEHGAMIGASGDGRVSSAARADLAEALAVVASAAGHEGKTYELAGDAAHTTAEIAAEVSRQSGKAVAFVNLPQADYAKALEGFGLPAGFAAILADADALAGEGALFDDSRTLSRLIGRPTTPLAASVATALAQL